jgi:peptidoglycan hydrolase CwlO-like protein
MTLQNQVVVIIINTIFAATYIFMESKENKSNNSKVYYILFILVLLVSNGIFIYNYFTTDKKLVDTAEELFKTDSVRQEVQNILDQTALELDDYKGRNEELDAFLQQKNDSLQEFAQRINVLLRQNRITRAQLDSVYMELDQLRYYKRKYLSQIDSLSNQISMLSAENRDLKANINQEKRKYENLNMENIKLNNKVAIGAKLNTESITVVGIRQRSSGKERETNRAAQTERIKVTFTIKENYVADIGSKEIFLKVYSADGTTLYNEATGSGVFIFEGTESLYTTKKTIEFDQTQQTVNIYWEKGTEYAKGKYKVELFSDGLKIGSTDFELK